MNTGIIGAGSIGQLFFHDLLDDHGISPSFIDTRLPPDTPPASITLAYHRDIGDPPCVPEHYQGIISPVSAAGKQDLIVITAKAWQGKQIYRELASFLPARIPVILLMNGMGSFEEAREMLPNPIFSGITSRGAIHRGYTVFPRGNGPVYIGSPEHLPAGKEISRFSRAVRGTLCENIRELQLRKLLINACINPLTALRQCRNAEIAGAFRNETLTLFTEIYPVIKDQGLDLPEDAAQDLVFSVARETGNNLSSMAVDFQKRRPSELDYILGYVLKVARSSDCELPMAERLYRTLKAKEKTFLFPESPKW